MLNPLLLFDTSDFPARWHCGNWTALHGWTHIISDVAIWGAYTTIPIIIGVLMLKRRDMPFPRIFWLFAAFILACGTTHLIDALIFFEPVYRLSALAKVITALVSWATVILLIKYAPQILDFPGLAVANAQLKREIAQRARVEQKLRENTEALRVALDAGAIGTWRVDLRTQQDFRDASLNRMLGLPANDSTQPLDDFFERVYQEDRERVHRRFSEAIEKRSEYSAEFRIVRADGSVRWLSGRGRVQLDAEREAVAITGAAIDITDLKLAEEGLGRLAAVVEASPDAIKTQTPSGIITHWNRGAEHLYGYTAEEAVGQHISLIVPESRRGEIDEYLGALREAREVPNMETVRRHKNGKLIDVSLSLAPIKNRHGGLLAISSIARDITERKQRALVIERLNRELTRKNDEMEQFVYTVSHDLKSPLVTMLGFVGLLREDLPETAGEDVEDSLERIERAAERMSHLIDDLLDLSRVGRTRGTPKPVDLAQLAHDVRDDLSERLDDAGVTLEIQEGLPTVQADPLRLRQVFDNLVGNALKYGCSNDNPKVTIGTVRKSDEIRVFVADNGAGVPPEYHQRIFRLFERLEAGKDGTGVGLALVDKIMESHGGRAWVESAPGEGATFWLAFPT